MTPSLRLFRLEFTELSPVLVPGLLLGALTGYIDAPLPLLGSGQFQLVLFAGACLGVAQGLLDRRFRNNAFVQHRPVGRVATQSARTLAGTVALLAVVGAMFAVRAATRESLDPSELNEVLVGPGSEAVDIEALFWSDAARQVALLGVGWSALRVAVSSPGLIAPVLLTPILVASVWLAGIFSLGLTNRGLAALGITIALLIYQGARLAVAPGAR